MIPGISSVQSAFALITEPWQGALWLSFHGRIPDDEQLRYEKGKKMAFLTDYEHNPSYIAKYLIKKGWPKETRAAACEHISYETQHINTGMLKEITMLDGFGESVLVVMG